MTDDERYEDIRKHWSTGTGYFRPGDANWMFWYIDKLRGELRESNATKPE